MVLKTGPSIKDVRKDGGGVRSNGDTCREGVKDLADVRKDGTFLELFQHALQTLPMDDGY